jgi:hypothetical protein
MMAGIGQMLVGMLFNFLLMMLFAPKPKDTISYGPRLDNLKPTVKDIQGQVINLSYGMSRVSGTVFWASAIRETAHYDTTEYSSKGGNNSYTHTDVTYTYDCDIAVGICEGPIVGIKKIWANKELIYNSDEVPNHVSWLKWRLYTGTENQGRDPILQANFGRELTPAHRGLAYIVFEQFQLDPFGRRIPQSLEFEVVSKGVVSGIASKYPQIDFAKFLDYGDSEVVPQINVMLMLNYNTLVIPLLNWGANSWYSDSTTGIPVRWASVNLSTSTITKYPIHSGNTWGGVGIGYGTWTSGSSVGGWHRHLGGFGWFPLNWGNGYKYAPCYIQCCSYDVGQNDYAYWQLFNIINGAMVGHGYLNGGYVGSFSDFYYSGMANGCIYTRQINVSSSTIYQHKVKEITKQGINPDPADYDQYGFAKGIMPISVGHYIEDTSPSGRCYIEDWKNNTIHHLVGFSNIDEVIEADEESEDFDPTTDPYKTVISKRHTILNTKAPIIGSYSRPDIIYYEDCTYNIMDSMEHGLACIAQVETVTTTKKYFYYLPTEETDVTESAWYPAEYGPQIDLYDSNPSPPLTVPPYTKNLDIYTRVAIFVHNIIGTKPDNVGNYIPTMWLRLSNGTEILCVNGKIYEKPMYKENLPKTFFGWLEYYGIPNRSAFLDAYMEWQIYMSIYGAKEDRIAKPNNLLPKIDDEYILGHDYTVTLDSQNAKICYIEEHLESYGYNNAPFEYKLNAVIPATYYYQPGATKVYWVDGILIKSMDLSTFEIITEIITNINPYQVIPYSGDFIGYAAHSGHSGYAALWYIRNTIIGEIALLGAIIEDITAKANISDTCLDISEAAYNVKVNGFNISDDIKLIDALETLLMHYFIDAYESEWKIKYRTRKEASNNVITLDRDELGVKGIGENNYNQKYKITLREDTSLPQSITYNYITKHGYTQANVIAIRNIDFNLGVKTTIKAPIVLYPYEAYSNSFRILFDVWRATKEYEFRLPNMYSYLEPGDIVLLPLDIADLTNEYLTVKITEIVAESTQYIELKGVEEDPRNIEGMISTDGAHEPFINTMLPTSNTQITILDTSPLYNKYTSTEYNAPGIYVGAFSDSKYWQGGSLFGSFDDLSYSRVQDYNIPGGIGGIVYSITNNLVDPYYLDTLNTITIQVTSYQDFFEPAEDDFYYLEGGTIALVSNSTGYVEILQYRNITYIDEDNNNKLIKFSNLQRGLYNTYNKSINYTFNDKVYYLPNSLKKVNIATNYYNSVIYYKGISFGQSIESTVGAPYKYKLNWYLPYGISNGYATSSGSNILLTWNHRERNKAGYLFHSPKQEDVLEYKIEIYKNNNLIRTIESITTNTYTYTSADMLTDGVTLYDILKFTIKRKAEFLDYNHNIYHNIIYTPNYNTINILNNKYPSNQKLYIDFQLQPDLNIITNDDVTYDVTYNNYNNMGKLNSKPACYGLSSKNFNRYENLLYSGLTSSSTHSGYMVIKIGSLSSFGTAYGSTPILSALNGSFDYLPYFNYTGASFTFLVPNSYCGQYSQVAIPPEKWVFIGWVVAGTSRKLYFKEFSTEDSVAYTQVATGCNGGIGTISSTGYIFNGSSGKNIDIQEFCIINGIDLYANSNNSFADFDSFYEIGKKKWLKQ